MKNVVITKSPFDIASLFHLLSLITRQHVLEYIVFH